MRPPKRQTLHVVELRFPNSITRSVKVRASSQEVAERRALKRNPSAIGVVQRG